MRCRDITANPAPQVTQGEAIESSRKIAETLLPKNEFTIVELGNAEAMRETIHDLAKLFQQFRALQEEDRVAADIVRSVSPGRLSEVNTFEFTTAVTQSFAASIAQVIAQSQRSTRDLLARPPVAIVR